MTRATIATVAASLIRVAQRREKPRPKHSASVAPDASPRTDLDRRCRKSRIMRRKSWWRAAPGVDAPEFVGQNRRGQIPLVVISPSGPALQAAVGCRTSGMLTPSERCRARSRTPWSALGGQAARAAVAAKMLEVAQLAQALEHLDRNRLSLERAVLVDPRVDAGRPALADLRAGDRILGLAVPVQRVFADLGQGDGRHDPVTVGRGADEPEVDLAHHERRPIVLDHLLDREADDPE